MPSLRLAAPYLLAVAVPLVLLVWWRVRKLPVDHVGARRRIIQGLMVGAAVCAALAVVGLEIGSRIDRLAVVFAVDRSRSVERAGEAGATQAMRAVRDAVTTMRADDKAGVVVFGAEAATEVVPSPSPAIGAGRASVPRDATDIAAAIRRALADLPAEHAGRIVVVSDGVETEGDALAAAASAASRGVIVDVVPVERAPRPEVAVDRVRVPQSADPGEPVELRVVTRATRDTPVRVRVIRDGQTLAEAETTVRQGDDVLTMRDIAPEPGVHRYDVLVEPIDAANDAARENNEGGAFLRVAGGSRALVIAGRPEEAAALGDAIRRTGIATEVIPPTQAPVDLATLASYDLLVLSDVSARAFTEDQMELIRQYVRDLGGGLLMVGVRDSFGLGGYAYTPVEEVLPATFDLRRRRDRASLGMIIAIDKSGSMTVEVAPGVIKLDLANEGAARSALLLSPFDRIGVMHVDTAVTWTVPMTAVSDPRAIAAQIRRAQPGGGGILVDLTLRASYERLADEPTQLKHLLLFSDGSDSEEMNQARSLVERALRDHRITTSIVSMGNGPDTPELERLSRIGQGRFYIVENMSELPRIFTQETIEASRSAIEERTFRPILGVPHAVTRGIDFAHGPPLGGYVVVNARPRASLLLAASDEDPLLMLWQHGVGKTAVLATDAGSGFAREWVEWNGYAALYGQLARDLARSPERRDAQVSVALQGGVGRIRVEAVDREGRYRNYLELGATVAGPDGQPVRVALTQTGAGRYEGTFPADAPGAYLVTVREGQGLVASAGVVRPSGDELRGEGTDRAKLAQIAALTGGRVRTDLRGVFTERPPPTYAFAPAWPWLIASAILMLLVSVAMRRLVIPGDVFRRMVPARVRRVLKMRTPRVAPVGVDPAATLAALSQAKGRAARTDVAPEVQAAMAAKVTPGVKAPAAAEQAKDDDEEPPPEGPAPPPSSLAEQLLERRRKRR